VVRRCDCWEVRFIVQKLKPYSLTQIQLLIRIINAEHEDNRLPFCPDPPGLDDFLPLGPLDDGVSYRVKDDLLLPQEVKAAESGLEFRDFTRFGSYAASV
jgi:hypothetical protein